MPSIDYRYLRPKKAAALRSWHEEPFHITEDLQVWSGKNATILPMRRVPGDPYLFGRGGVVDASGNYVELSAIKDRVESGYPFENPAYVDKKVVFCGYFFTHWGHFLIETVARLWYFLENDSSIDSYVFFVNENSNQVPMGNYREFFQLFGIWDKLEFIDTPTAYREVVVPQVAFHFRDYYSSKYLRIFDTIAGNVQPQPDWDRPEKLFFTRSQFVKCLQYEFGHDALDDFFRKNGYTIISPEKLTLSQTIYYIRNAREVASVSGTLPHNLLFGNPGQKLVIVERGILNNDCQVNVNRMKHLNTTYIDANYALYTVAMIGPFMLGYTPLLERYAQDHGMQPPAECYRTDAYRNQNFCKYMAAYQDEYRYQWYMEDWFVEATDYLVEAYRDSFPYFEAYLKGNEPCLKEHRFQFHYFKQFIKKILRKLGLWK